MREAIRNWLIEHFDFVPREDFDRRLRVIGEVAKVAASLEVENKLLEIERDNLLFELETRRF